MAPTSLRDCLNSDRIRGVIAADCGYPNLDKNQFEAPPGWLTYVNGDESLSDRVREFTKMAVITRIAYSDFLKALNIEIKHNRQIPENIRSDLEVIVWDVFAEFDRQVGYRSADCLGYRAAIYEGGLVDYSRDFCRERNGKVFTFDEIKLFGTSQDIYGGYTDKESGEFKGKPQLSYNPFFHQGGYECRHAYSYIPDRLAVRLRPELKDIWGAALKKSKGPMFDRFGF